MGMGTNVGLASEVPAGNEDLHTGSQTCRKCRSDFETRLFMPTRERTRYAFSKGLLRDTHGRAVSMAALISARVMRSPLQTLAHQILPRTLSTMS